MRSPKHVDATERLGGAQLVWRDQSAARSIFRTAEAAAER